MTYQYLFKTFKQALSEVFDATEVNSIFFIAVEYITGMSRTDFYLNSEEQAPTNTREFLYKVMNRLKKGEPIQYILNEAWFMEKKYYVDHNVLIPRSETEEMIGIVKSIAPKAKKVLDIGTGSGCIAISLSLSMPANVWAMDNDEAILYIARKNALANKAEVNFFQDDILNPTKQWEKPFDVIVSNPPYVKMSEKQLMQKNVLDFEPEKALFVADNDPLVFYKAIYHYSRKYLSDHGIVVLEINESLAHETKALFEGSFSKVESIRDIHNKERFVTAQHERK